VALTHAIANGTMRGGRALLLPVQIKGPGGETPGETAIRLPSDVLTRQPAAVQSLEPGLGGEADEFGYEQLPPSSEMAPKPTAKPCGMRKGRNTLVVERQSRQDVPATPGQEPMIRRSYLAP
jgi:hypothetical protein